MGDESDTMHNIVEERDQLKKERDHYRTTLGSARAEVRRLEAEVYELKVASARLDGQVVAHDATIGRLIAIIQEGPQ